MEELEGPKAEALLRYPPCRPQNVLGHGSYSASSYLFDVTVRMILMAEQ